MSDTLKKTITQVNLIEHCKYYSYIYIHVCVRYIYIYIYIYILSSTDRSVSFYQNSSVWLDRQDSRSRDRSPVNANAIPRSYHSATRASEGNLNGYVSQLFFLFTYIRLTATESSIHIKILPLSHEETSASEGNLNGYVSQLFFLSVLYIYIYIYIYGIPV